MPLMMRDNRDDIDARVVQVVDRLELHIEQISDEPMRIGLVSDAVELQIRIAKTGFGRLLAELGTLGELDPVGGGLNAVVADLSGVTNCVQEVRRQRRLTAGKLHGHLPARLDRNRVVQQRLDVFPASAHGRSRPGWRP